LLLIVLSVLFFLAAFLLSILEWKAIPVYVLAFLVREYTFWIVTAYIKEIKNRINRSTTEKESIQADGSQINSLPTIYIPNHLAYTYMTKELDSWSTVDKTLHKE